MKKIKFKKIIPLVIVSLAVFVQCDKEETTLIEPNVRAVFTSEMNFENKINVNQDIDFGDASAGVVSRTWTFPDNVVNIDKSENNTTSTSKIVKAFFNRPGTYNVNLSQTFKGEVFNKNGSTGSNTADTTIVVRVLPEVNINLTANYLNNDGTLGAALNMVDNAENEVLASKKIRFSYTTTGEPDNFDWTFEGASPDTFDGDAPDVDVTYRSLGTHDLNFIANRERPLGGDTISIKNLIKVIPSSEPVTLDAVNENKGKIGLEFSRDMDPSSADPNNFTVSLENKGVVIPVSITDIDVDPASPNILLITLNETVYRDDKVNVSYTPGLLSTSDQVKADAIPSTEVKFERLENIFDTKSNMDYSFENSTNSNWVDAGWGGIWALFNSDVSSMQAKTGSKSIYVEYDANGGMVLNGKTNTGDNVTFPAETGKDYEIGVWTYLVDGGSPDPTFTPDVRLYWFPDTDWSIGATPGFSPSFVTGEWVYSSIFVKFNETGDKTLTIRGWNEFNSSAVKFYMDDLTLREVQLRP